MISCNPFTDLLSSKAGDTLSERSVDDNPGIELGRGPRNSKELAPDVQGGDVAEDTVCEK